MQNNKLKKKKKKNQGLGETMKTTAMTKSCAQTFKSRYVSVLSLYQPFM